MVGLYEVLFIWCLCKYWVMGLYEQELGEVDYKCLIFEEYIFFKWLVVVVEDEIFIGNSKSVVVVVVEKVGINQ